MGIADAGADMTPHSTALTTKLIVRAFTSTSLTVTRADGPDTISIVQGAELLVCGAGGRRGYRMPMAAPTDCSRRLACLWSPRGVLDAACAERQKFSALLKMLRAGLT